MPRVKKIKKKTKKKTTNKERDPKKIKKIIKQKGYKSGKLPRGKVLHHVKPVSQRGKTTKKNTRIVSKRKHVKIHKNRRKKNKV